MTIYKHVLKKQKNKTKKKHCFSDTFSVVHFYSVYTVHIKARKKYKWVRPEIPQSYTTDHDQAWYYNAIKQRNQFHFERKLYAQKCVSVSVPFVPNVVVQHVSGFVACCVEATQYKWKVPSYLWVVWHTMLVSVYAISLILWGTVTGHNYSPYYNVAV